MILRSIKRFEYFFGNPFSADRLFRNLSPSTTRTLNRIKKTRELAAGEMICSAGQTPCCFYVFRQGEAQWVVRDEKNRWLPIRLIDRDEIIGLTEVLADLPYETNVETITPCVVESIKKADFFALLVKEPQLSFRLVKLLGAGLQRSHELLRSQSF